MLPQKAHPFHPELDADDPTFGWEIRFYPVIGSNGRAEPEA
jgi:hypothetical protein